MVNPTRAALVAAGAASFAVATVVACSGKTTTVPDKPLYYCPEASTSPTCPSGKECPALPTGQGGCEGVPGLFGNPPQSTDAGRVEGCEVFLPYENPYYPGGPQTCFCQERPGDGGLGWICPL